jgi:hypothetical protein
LDSNYAVKGKCYFFLRQDRKIGQTGTVPYSRQLWQVMIGMAGLRLLLRLLMADVPTTSAVDETFGPVKDKKVGDIAAP